MPVKKTAVEKFKSSRQPWEIFQHIYHSSEVCFFLDSPSYRPPNQTFSYLGFDPVMEISVQGRKTYVSGNQNERFPSAKLFSFLRTQLEKYRLSPNKRQPFLTGGFIGYWGYESTRLFEKIRFRKKENLPFPDVFLGLYQNLIVYDHKERHYWLVAHDFSKSKTKTAVEAKLKKALQRLRNCFELHGSGPVNPFSLEHFHEEIPRVDFEKIVKKTKSYIRSGDIYQANLSQRFRFDYQGSPLFVYEKLRKINPSPFASFLKVRDFCVLSSSPERLIRKRGESCETQPIAGTRPRKRKKQTEQDLQAELLSNEKERAEHIMMVDLERNDLGKVCFWPTVRVKKMMTIEKYSHVIHLVSKITGQIRPEKDSLDLLQAMFPGGTITGCPKIRCMQIIDELEPVKRGLYTGSIGYLSLTGDMDLNIVIRTLTLKKNQGFFQVGAGIVYDSNPKREYEETLHKGEALAEALVQASG